MTSSPSGLGSMDRMGLKGSSINHILKKPRKDPLIEDRTKPVPQEEEDCVKLSSPK